MAVTVTQTPLAQSRVQLTIVVTPELLEKGKRQAMNEIRAEAEIKGFRKGKAPDRIIEAHFGPEYIASYGQGYAIDEAYRAAVMQEKIKVIGQPADLKIEEQQPFTFSLSVAVLPEIKIDGYEKIKIEKKDMTVTKEEMNAYKADLKKRFTSYEKVEEGDLAKGDRAHIGFEGFDPKTGESIPGTKSEDHPLIVGEGSLIPGFEEHLEGMKTGEEKDFEITFPKEYHNKEFQSRVVKFHVKINQIEKAKMPEIDEAFIEQLRGKKMTVKEFDEQLEHQLLHEKEHAERDRREGAYLEEGAKKYVTMDIPQALIDEELDFMEREMRERIAGMGVPFEDYLAHMGQTVDGLRKEQEKTATDRAKARLFLSAVAEKEDVEVTDADIEEEVNHIASHYEHEEMREQVRKIYKDKKEARQKLMARTKMKKLFDKLLG